MKPRPPANPKLIEFKQGLDLLFLKLTKIMKSEKYLNGAKSTITTGRKSL